MAGADAQKGKEANREKKIPEKNAAKKKTKRNNKKRIKKKKKRALLRIEPSPPCSLAQFVISSYPDAMCGYMKTWLANIL